jgi:hypothetical protein
MTQLLRRCTQPNLYTCPTPVFNRGMQLDLPWTFHILNIVEALQEPYNQVTSFSEGKLFCKQLALRNQ